MTVPEDLVESKEVRYSARNVSDYEEQQSFSNSLTWIVTNHRLEAAGISPQLIRQEMAQGRVRLKSRQVTDQGEIEKSGGASFALTYILTYVLLLMMMIYGQMTMRSVIEEKSQRITRDHRQLHPAAGTHGGQDGGHLRPGTGPALGLRRHDVPGPGLCRTALRPVRRQPARDHGLHQAAQLLGIHVRIPDSLLPSWATSSTRPSLRPWAPWSTPKTRDSSSRCPWCFSS